MRNKAICGILLYDEAFAVLSDALEPYLQVGRIGKFIYATKVCHDGAFLNITVTPELTNGRISDIMEISIPLRYVKFIAWSPSKIAMGFA